MILLFVVQELDINVGTIHGVALFNFMEFTMHWLGHNKILYYGKHKNLYLLLFLSQKIPLQTYVWST